MIWDEPRSYKVDVVWATERRIIEHRVGLLQKHQPEQVGITAWRETDERDECGRGRGGRTKGERTEGAGWGR